MSIFDMSMIVGISFVGGGVSCFLFFSMMGYKKWK